MGSLILCHKKRAKQPYMITRVHIRIYTIEELCYYICNNLYLIDYTLMNRQLCEWIREELHMWELADQLLGQMEKNCTAEQFVLTILEKSNVYSPGEINKVQNMLKTKAFYLFLLLYFVLYLKYYFSFMCMSEFPAWVL